MPTRKQLESEFRTGFKERLKEDYPGCMLIPQNPNMIQGIPDLLMLWEDRWASFETKRAFSSAKQPNQPHYVEKMNDMSFSAFVSPDNVNEVLDELQQALRPSR